MATIKLTYDEAGMVAVIIRYYLQYAKDRSEIEFYKNLLDKIIEQMGRPPFWLRIYRFFKNENFDR